MSVTDTKKIDFIGIDKIDGDVVLTISDHMDWNDVTDHLTILQDKLNTYLSFIESGEIFEAYPNSKERKIIIDIASQHELPKEGVKFIELAQKMVQDAGFELRQQRVQVSQNRSDESAIVLTQEELVQIFSQLENGSISREVASSWARERRIAQDEQQLHYQPKSGISYKNGDLKLLFFV